MSDGPTETTGKMSPGLRMAVDYLGPLALFLTVLITHDMLKATWALVIASAVALVLFWVVERRIAPLPLIFGGLGLVFGVIALVFHDPRIVKMKTTVISAGLGVAVLTGHFMGKSPLKLLLGDALKMTEAGWRKLTWRYGAFFLFLAALNEVIWRTQSDSFWAAYHLFGSLGLTLLFSFSQMPLMLKDRAALDAAAALAETQE
jgi:intracellular septation protein